PTISFFFSSRRRHTRFSRDWSSDVCSSDLRRAGRSRCLPRRGQHHLLGKYAGGRSRKSWQKGHEKADFQEGSRKSCTEGEEEMRSEERRVGKGVGVGGARIRRKSSRREMQE